VLKRDGGFATQDAAKTAGREDAKKIKNSHQADRPAGGPAFILIFTIHARIIPSD
jgi:hypothetical protein